MRPRALLLATLALASITAGVGAAALAIPPLPEQVVEGHTVFTTIETAPTTSSTEEFAAAVAVLVREINQQVTAARFPGVLWFNDQFLVNPFQERLEDEPMERFPCTGAVLAVPQGDGDPRVGAPGVFDADAYVESYLVTDPNDYVWEVDRWNVSGRPVWTVAVMNNQPGYGTPDDGTCTGGAAVPQCGYGLQVPTAGCPRMLRGVHVEGLPAAGGRNPGDHGYGYPCGDVGTSCEPVRYNALLYFLLSDLPDAGVAPKDHNASDPNSDWWYDVAACQAYTEPWPCPEDDDDREGNSHPYHPHSPLQPQAGAGNHGGSASCDGDAATDQNCHATRRIDIYYGVAAAPEERRYRVLDLVGSSAPYHCHDEVFLGGTPALNP